MKIVIIGGVAAGAKAAAKSRRILPDAEIDLYTQDSHVSYSSCGLPYFIEGNFDDYRMLLVRSPEAFESQNIHIHLKNRAIKILPELKQVLIDDLENKNAFLVKYDKLILATGARPNIPPIENVNLKNIFTLRTIEDGINIKEKMKSSKRAIIIGSGYIGIELLEAFVKQGLHVDVIEHSPYIMPVLDEDMSILVKEQLTEICNGRFEFHNDELATRFIGDNDGVKKVVTVNGNEYEGDFVVLAVGVSPNVEIAKDAKIALGSTGAIKVDCTMRTNIDDIYACGDCVEENLIISNTPIWVPLGSNANKEGRCAAINACGEHDCFNGVLGSTVTRCLALTISMTGLTVKYAQKLGYDPAFVAVSKDDKVGYMPNANNIVIKLVADKTTGILLGAQGVGSGNVDKRINALTAALTAKMTVREFYGNDLSYAPPYSPTIDPLLNAAQILMHKVKQ